VDADTMLHYLEELAGRLEIEVRYQASSGRVGLGVLRGQKIAIIEADLRVPERVGALASLLADQDIEGVYVPEEVREHLASCLSEPGATENDDGP